MITRKQWHEYCLNVKNNMFNGVLTINEAPVVNVDTTNDVIEARYTGSLTKVIYSYDKVDWKSVTLKKMYKNIKIVLTYEQLQGIIEDGKASR